MVIRAASHSASTEQQPRLAVSLPKGRSRRHSSCNNYMCGESLNKFNTFASLFNGLTKLCFAIDSFAKHNF